MNSWKLMRPLAGLDGEIRNVVADTDVALLLQLLVRLDKDGFRSFVLELEHRVRRLVDIRQQGLVFVTEQFHGAPLDCSGEHQLAVRLANQRQVESERIIFQELLLRRRVYPLQDLVAVRKTAETMDHRDMPVKYFMEGVQRIVRLPVRPSPGPTPPCTNAGRPGIQSGTAPGKGRRARSAAVVR